jgi:cytidylate kinase
MDRIDSTSGQPEAPPGRETRPTQLRPVVTIASLYGGGGGLLGPRVAERLGVQYLDRAIPTSVARRAGVPEAVVASVDEPPRTGLQRLVENLARAPVITDSTGAVERLDVEERRIKAEIEEFLAAATVSGGVVLGRGGQVVLAKVPGALHVYLGGSREDRIRTTMEREGHDRRTAERRIDAHDRARRGYVLETYGVNGDDPGLYHMMLDGPAFGLDYCVELIVAAAQYRVQQAMASARR